MSQFEDRHLDFVLKHYQEGKFDTTEAIDRFNKAHGIMPKPRRRIIFFFSGVAAAVLLGVFLFHSASQNRWTELEAHAAVRIVVLPDGSDVTLAPGSSLRYRVRSPRIVEMTGKAFFDVARDESAPFEVHSECAFVRVLGTEFMVDAIRPEVTSVYVSEGKVLFATSKDQDGVMLTEGMEAVLEHGWTRPEILEEPDVNSIAWHRGTFVFEDTPLKEVLTCLSQYYNVSFVASDLDKRLSGEFSTEDLDLIISLIESALDVTIVK